MKRLFAAWILLALALPFAQAQSSAHASPRVEAIISKMSLDEKLAYIGGIGFSLRPMPQYGVPKLDMSDGPAGLRSNSGKPSTAYPSGVALAAAWNKVLALRLGDALGRDAHARGVHFLLGPGVNIYRSPLNGRNFEYLGEDPYLAAQLAVGYVKGVQQHNVSATIKHFLGNNSEFDRHNSNSIIGERALREIYLPVFEAAVKQAHVGAIMDSYNLVNGHHMTQSPRFNTELLRGEWGFDGVVMSDWMATYDAVEAANGGLDVEMPMGMAMNPAALKKAIDEGKISVATIDEKLRHILTLAERMGWLDAAVNNDSLYDRESHAVALEQARESLVLLKNDKQTLPLDASKLRSLLIVGPTAYPAVTSGGGSGKVIPYSAASILEGVSGQLGEGVKVYYEAALPTIEELAARTKFKSEGRPGLTLESFADAKLGGEAKKSRAAHIASKGGGFEGVLSDMDDWASMDFSAYMRGASHRYTGVYNAAEAGVYELAAQGGGEDGGFRVYVDDKLVVDRWTLVNMLEALAPIELTAGEHKIIVEDWQKNMMGGRLFVGLAPRASLVSSAAKTLAAKVDAVLVAVGYNSDNESEGGDRAFTLPFGQDELISELAAINPKTIVAVTSGGAFDSSRWLDKASALIEMWQPGEAGGRALGETLVGANNPSGRLPISFERRAEDNPSRDSYYPKSGVDVHYDDGVFVGYRGYQHNNVKPLFAFGYGLSYTSFAFSDLKLSPAGKDESSRTVSFTVANTGKRAGMAVAELYVSAPQSNVTRPVRELKGFAKIALQPGEKKSVTLALDARSFAYYDEATKTWLAPAGDYRVELGQSSEQIDLSAVVKLTSAHTSEQ